MKMQKENKNMTRNLLKRKNEKNEMNGKIKKCGK